MSERRFVMTPSLTLYAIETGLLELLQLRDDIEAETLVTAEAEADRKAELTVIDKEIAEYVQREIVKCDNITGLLRECKARAETLKAEEQRIAALCKRWEDREKRVKERVAEVLAMQVEPETITAAKQNQVLKRLSGRNSELKLCKSPASVEVTDMSLLPEKLQRITVTMTLAQWKALGVSVNLADASASIDPDKRAIAAAIKESGSVPGARLVEDSVHVRLG